MAELTYLTGYISRWFTRPRVQVLTRQCTDGVEIRNLLITSPTP